MTYDTAGNIVEKKESAFTLGLFDTIEKTTAGKYVYGDNGVKDRLLSFNGENIEYDALGNPTTYRDYNLTWSHVNRLAKFGSIEFQYNYAGTRLFKTVGAKKTKYYCDGSKVIAQDDGTDMLYFYYGTEGVTAFKYNNTVYHYKKDMLGNILGIYDGNGQLLVKYVYDAWGNHKTFALQNNIWVDISSRTAYTTSDNTATKIAILNPFRYRSYYFDIEIGLYYLQTRYYDPETGRFISMDSIEYLDPESIHGLNLYAYCGNNPVMAVDGSGTSPKWWQWLIAGIGVALIATAAVLASVGTGGVAAFGVGALIGSVSVGVGGAVIGGAIGYAVGGIDGMWQGALIGFGIGATVGFIVGGAIGASAYSSALGTNFGKMGTVVKHPGIKVNWSLSMRHGPERMLQRGVTKRLVNSTVRKGIALSQTGGKFAFVTQKAVAVVSSSGVLITTYGKEFYDAGMLEIIKVLFGG